MFVLAFISISVKDHGQSRIIINQNFNSRKRWIGLGTMPSKCVCSWTARGKWLANKTYLYLFKQRWMRRKTTFYEALLALYFCNTRKAALGLHSSPGIRESPREWMKQWVSHKPLAEKRKSQRTAARHSLLAQQLVHFAQERWHTESRPPLTQRRLNDCGSYFPARFLHCQAAGQVLHRAVSNPPMGAGLPGS